MKNKPNFILIATTLLLFVSCGSKKQVAFFPTSEVTYQDFLVMVVMKMLQ
jgi:hypothetical protein